MVELPPDAFRFGNYQADIPMDVFTDDVKLLKWMADNNPVGYCREPSYKPCTDYVAVLFDLEEHGEYWSHIPEWVFKKYMESV